jgi:hypothetical protein
MKRMLAVLIMLALPMMAQEQKKTEEAQPAKPVPGGMQRLFILKYADVNQVSQLLNIFTGAVRPSPAMHALAVTGSAEAMAAIEDAIKRLDVPSSAPQSVEIMAYFLHGSSDAQDVVGSDPPKDLDSTLSQLRNAFAYRTYKLMEALPMRARTGQVTEASSTGAAVKIGERLMPVFSQIRIGSVSADADGRIRLTTLRVGLRVPTASGQETVVAGTRAGTANYTDVGISTDVDMKEGQKVVVGKSGLNPNEAIFVVLTARVVQ